LQTPRTFHQHNEAGFQKTPLAVDWTACWFRRCLVYIYLPFGGIYLVETFKAIVRPMMALSGWVALVFMLAQSFMSYTPYPPAWVIAILLSPSVTWFGLRFVQKQRD